MSKPKTIHTVDCGMPHLFEYRHNCTDELCLTYQCMNCAAWATSCDMHSEPANPGLTNVFDLQHTISAYETVLLDLVRSADVIPSGLFDRRQFLQAKLADMTNANN